jgi:hypothetical protein
MNRLRIFIIVLALIALTIRYVKSFRMQCTFPEGEGLVVNKEWLKNKGDIITPEKYRRAADNTFWVYPEWYLVHSPAEQADYFKEHTSTSLSYTTHIDQFWDSYKVLRNQMEGNFEPNGQYSFMVNIIGVSTTVEYAMKAWYEKVIGRFTDTWSPQTDEDRFNAEYLDDYVSFIRKEPWYKFDYVDRLKRLWTENSLFGANMLRKWDRKYMLTSEILFKAAYAKLMNAGAETMFDPVLFSTVVVVDKLPEDIGPDAELLKLLPDSSAILQLPRYAAFSPAVQYLANQNVNLKEVAGNSTAILISVLTSMDFDLIPENCQVLFTQPVVSKDDLQRIVFVTPVANLTAALSDLKKMKVKLEHIYDF